MELRSTKWNKKELLSIPKKFIEILYKKQAYGLKTAVMENVKVTDYSGM